MIESPNDTVFHTAGPVITQQDQEEYVFKFKIAFQKEFGSKYILMII